MDDKVSAQSFKTYRDWQRYILKSHPKLTKGCAKATLVAYCFAMSSHGTNGLGCYTSDAVIANELGLYDHRAVRPYRHEALRLGWLAWTGEMKGRSQVLDVAIPEENPGQDHIRVTSKLAGASNVEHIDVPLLRHCPACKPNIGRMADSEIFRIHFSLVRWGVSDAQSA